MPAAEQTKTKNWKKGASVFGLPKVVTDPAELLASACHNTLKRSRTDWQAELILAGHLDARTRAHNDAQEPINQQHLPGPKAEDWQETHGGGQ